jgi:hypothetical protein
MYGKGMPRWEFLPRSKHDCPPANRCLESLSSRDAKPILRYAGAFIVVQARPASQYVGVSPGQIQLGFCLEMKPFLEDIASELID